MYNIFQRQALAHNIPAYKKYGIRKKYYSPISSRDFKSVSSPAGEELDRLLINYYDSDTFKNLHKSSQESIKSFEENGFAVLRQFVDSETVDKINVEVEDLLTAGKIKYRYGNKLMFVIRHSPTIKSLGSSSELQKTLDHLMKGKAVLFQSINFKYGSEQATHSDSIHMTTFPLGGLLGVWIALEDITEQNGPVHYYPGSHKLPYYLNEDYDNEGNYLMIGKRSYVDYENMMRKKIQELGLKKSVFTARKGDVLIWHANLFHGGEPHIDKTLTRKSLVFHYFKKHAVCYHEITQRPALICSYTP